MKRLFKYIISVIIGMLICAGIRYGISYFKDKPIDISDTMTQANETGYNLATGTYDANNEDAIFYQRAYVLNVIDGDTLLVKYDDTEYRVRLIGIDTPESVAPDSYLEKSGKENTEEGMLASDYTKSLLEGYDIVYLESDTSDTDIYGRLLRYVWLELPDANAVFQHEVQSKMLNGILLHDGVAEIATYEPDTLYKDIFYAIYANTHYDEYYNN